MTTSLVPTLFQRAVALLYPARCMSCGQQVDSDFGLCGACWRDTPFIGGTVCESCGVPLLGVADGSRIECDACLERPRQWQNGRAVFLYEDTARRLVLSLKHGDRTDIARPAGLWLARSAAPIMKENMLIAPVPLHWRRLLARRYNQSALLAKSLGRATGSEVCPDLFLRHRRTPSLDGKGVSDRHATLAGAVRIHPGRQRRIVGRNVLIVDDVMTSGATFSACAEAAHDAGAASVAVVALARVPQDNYMQRDEGTGSRPDAPS